MMMKKSLSAFLFSAFLLGAVNLVDGQTVPVIKEGEAQVVEGFNTPDKWIREDL